MSTTNWQRHLSKELDGEKRPIGCDQPSSGYTITDSFNKYTPTILWTYIKKNKKTSTLKSQLLKPFSVKIINEELGSLQLHIIVSLKNFFYRTSCDKSAAPSLAKSLGAKEKADWNIHQPSSGNISNNSSFTHTPAFFWV